MLDAIGKAVAAAEGPRQQVEGGFAAYFHLVVTHPAAFNLLFGSNVPNDPELSRAVRKVQDTIAEAIDPLIDAGLDEDHRRLLAYAMVGMAEGASHHFVATREPGRAGPGRGRGRPPGPTAGRPGLGRTALGAPRLRPDRPRPARPTSRRSGKTRLTGKLSAGRTRAGPDEVTSWARRPGPSSASRTR